MLSRLFENSVVQRSKQLGNIVEATYFIRLLRKVAGASVITIDCASDNKVIPVFTWFGFITFIIWYSLYYYCLFQVFIQDQTVLRLLYDTRLQHYGDEVERFTVCIFSLYAMWKISFDLSGSTEDMQLILDIDKALQELGEQVHYLGRVHMTFVILLAQGVISSTRIFSVWMSLRNVTMSIQIGKVFQMTFTDAIIFVITAQYCSYLSILKRRYKMINKALNSIRLHTSSELFKFCYQGPTAPRGILNVTDLHISKKIKACGRIYGMIYKATQTANNKFGFVLLFMMFMALLFTILYLYYFMEATASGLFHEPETYIAFLIYVFWQIGYALLIMLVCIYFCELTVKEAQITPQIIHQIINSDLGSMAETEAVNMSLQILHQEPVFTAYGLFKLDYVMVLEGARSVTTFLVILLQFVTDKH